MTKTPLRIFLGCTAALLLLVPQVSAKKLSGSLTAGYNNTKTTSLNYPKIREYNTLPEHFSLTAADLLYKTRRARAAVTLFDVGEDDSAGALRLDRGEQFILNYAQGKIPHLLALNRTVVPPFPAVATERHRWEWGLQLRPRARYRLTVGQFREDKVGSHEAGEAIGQRNEGDMAALNGLAWKKTHFNAAIGERTFRHATYSAKESTLGLSLYSNPVKKHYAEASYVASDLKPELINAAGKIEDRQVSLNVAAAVSNRLDTGLSYTIDKRTNYTQYSFSHRRDTFVLSSDYSAGSLDVSLFYDMTDNDVFNVGALSANSDTLGLGLDYRYSIFKLKYDYTSTNRDNSGAGATLEDFYLLSGNTLSRNFSISTRNLKHFGMTWFHKDNRAENNPVQTYGTRFSKTRISGLTAYLLYGPKMTITLNTMNTQWAISGLTQNKQTAVDYALGIYQSHKLFQLGASYVLDRKNTLSATLGRTHGRVSDSFAENKITGRNYSLSLSRRVDRVTSLEASIIRNRYNDLVSSAYNGNTHQVQVRATRKF